jgi:hypothetical protein
MAEAGISLLAERAQRLEADRLAGEQMHEPRRQFGVRQATQGAPLGGAQLRPIARHIEATVFGQAGEQHLVEITLGRPAAGGDITHAAQTKEIAAGTEGAKSFATARVSW